jgi:site-specific DNA-methyltransferase (adenine-specific)
MARLPDASVDLVLCDLPYGTTRNKWDSVIPLDALWSEYRRVLKSGSPVVLTCQQPFTTTLAASNLSWLKTEWIWQKSQGTGFLNAKKYPLKSHENVLVFCDQPPPYFPVMKAGGKPYRVVRGESGRSDNYGKYTGTITENTDGTRYPVTVLKFKHDQNKVHPTQKPVALMEYLIRTYTNPGDTVLDNCMGSGTTGVACINTGRSFIGIEQDEKYFRIAAQRIEEAKTLNLTLAA